MKKVTRNKSLHKTSDDILTIKLNRKQVASLLNMANIRSLELKLEAMKYENVDMFTYGKKNLDSISADKICDLLKEALEC